MPDLVEELKELNEKLDSTLEATTAAQQKANEVGEKYANTDSTVQKAVEDAAKTAEEVQQIKQRIEAAEKTAEYIEKAISRLSPTGDESEAKELESKSHDQMLAYLRKKTPMDDDVIEATTRAMVSKSLFGVPDSVKENEVKTLIAGSNPDGGYWIRPERSAMMIERIFESSPVRMIANVQTTNTDAVEFIIDDDEAASGGWVGEVDARPTTDSPKIGKLTIPIHEQFAQPKATQKMLDDAGFDIEAWLAGKVTRRMTRVENTAFVSGDGSQKPRGWLSLSAWATNSGPGTQGVYQRGNLERINSGVQGAFVADTIKLLQNSLIEDYQASAVFGIKRAAWQQVTILKDGQGQYLLDPRTMKVGDTLTLLGKRVVFMNDMPDVANDALAMVYGDFSVGYTIVDRMGFRVIRDNVTEKPNILYYTTKRTGGDVTNYEALKIYQLSS